MEFYSRYNPPPQVSVWKFGKSETVSSMAEQTTIKYQIDRFTKTGIWGDPISSAKARFDDLTRYGSFADVQQKYAYCKSLFESLSPADKEEIGSVSEFIDYLTDGGNKDDELFQEAHALLGQNAELVFAQTESNDFYQQSVEPVADERPTEAKLVESDKAQDEIEKQ